ncbi:MULTISPECIES: hypothetical protein [unclassified Streptomyces]|uniref:hypothetical protein n=1 Tax=unclassified Streptomyces TaxID=2593676 RepID=UPI0029671F98|nr:hypothetical protein [Streptomyces sp. SJL17-1]
MTESREDAELALKAAELVTRWVSASKPLTEAQGWVLVGLQHAGSGNLEMRIWENVDDWERRLVEVLAADDGSEDSRRRSEAAQRAAVSEMRDMLLDGIPRGESANRIWRKGQGPDPRDELRQFVESESGKTA